MCLEVFNSTFYIESVGLGLYKYFIIDQSYYCPGQIFDSLFQLYQHKRKKVLTYQGEVIFLQKIFIVIFVVWYLIFFFCLQISQKIAFPFQEACNFATFR